MTRFRARVLVGLAGLSLVTASFLASADAASGPPGPVVAWGANSHGQLGDGTTVQRNSPVAVCPVGQTAPCPGQLTSAVQVAAGDDDLSAALLSDGTVLAWGQNTTGAVGDGTTTDRSTPVRVCAVGQTAPCSAFLSGVTSIAAGRSHVLALLTDGTVVSWGANNQGQLGDGTITNRSTPVRVCAIGQPTPCSVFLTGVSQLVGANNHSVALRADGSVVTWGNNDSGQLGNGTTAGSVVPVQVCAQGESAPCSAFLSGVTSIGPGLLDNSLAVGPGGVVYAWGNNFFGQLGDGTTVDRPTPVQACAVGQTAPCSALLTGITSVAGGSFSHSLAVGAGGAAFAWGSNGSGQLGDGTTTSRSTPVRVCAVGQTAPCSAFLTGVGSVSAGTFHSVAVLSGGGMLSWGFGGNGELGGGNNTSRSVPGTVCAVGQTAPCSSTLSNVTSAVAGDDHTLAVVNPPAADIQVRLSASASLLNPTITYTVTGINRGPGTVTSGTITLRVPDSTTSVSAAGCSYNSSNQTVACPTGQLGVKQSSSHTVRATQGALTVGLPLPATATRTASTPVDPNPTNDRASADCLVVTGLIILC
jgi:alpha-tubulin suppressor-like RCC1 family protein